MTAAVIVNFRTADQTVAAVRSLLASHARIEPIIVVDNGSGDGSARRIGSALDGIRLIEESANRGFSAGCNAGIRLALEAGAGRILLLNSDASVSDTAVADMARLLDDDRIGIAGPIVVSKANPTLVESIGISYSRVTGRMWNRFFGRSLDSVMVPACETVDAVSGCAMLIKRGVFERVGLLNEDYFFGFEDVDFCLRARAVGLLSAITGNAVVEHEGQASVGRRSPQRIYFATRNHLLVAHRVSASQPFPTRWLQTTSILGLNLAHALFSSDVSRLGGLRGFVRGARDHFSGRYGPSGWQSGA